MYTLSNIALIAKRVLKTVYNRCGIRDSKKTANDNCVTFSVPDKLKDIVSEVELTCTHQAFSKKRHSLLLFFTLFLGSLSSAYAGEFCVANPQFNGVIDGTIAYTSPPLNTITQVTIDGDCTFKNFTTANPLDVTINFQTNDPSIYLISFDNVIFSGNMACSNIDHKLWVVNSPEGAFSNKCQDIIIPAETIAKDIPAPTAGIGEPFTYTLTLPSMEFPVGDPSPNDLGNVVLTDDLNALGVDVTLVGTPTVEWKSGGAVPHTFTNNAGLLTFILPNITSGDQMEIKITLVLDDTVLNTVGKQFTNTARWSFSRWIDLDENGIVEDGTFDADGDGILEDEFFDPLPGENGVSLPITIAEPALVVSKTSNETALNLGIPATYSIDVQNNGGSNAWHTTILDRLPNIDAPDPDPVGICDTSPIATISAQVYAADGTTSVSGLLAPGFDYSVAYTGAPTCELSLTMLTPKAVIGPTERLIITYQSQLDVGTTRDAYILTNIAAATEWFSADGTYPRITHSRTLTDGTPAVVDHEDSYDITTALSGYYFQKTVQNLTTGANPAVSGAPGDTMRYRLRVFNVDQNIDTISISDVLDPAKFDTATFNIVPPIPANSTFSFNPVTGELVVQGFPAATDLNVAQGSELIVDFDINLAAGLTNGDIVPNQATLSADGPLVISSDDPYKNGIAAPGDPTDSTDILIQSPGALAKVKPAQTTASIGEQFTYTITVPAVPVNVPLYDVRILDDLTASSADLSFVGANVVSGGTWALTNTGTSTNVVIEDASTGIDIPANGQAVIEITVQLQNTTINQAGVNFSNTASFSYNRANGDNGTQTAGAANTSLSMTIVEPDITTITKVADKTTPTAGEIVRYSVTLDTSSGTNYSDVYDLIITDSLSPGLVYEGNPTVTVGAGVSADNTIAAPDITGDGSVATPQT
ncbi:MAG: isopeptide-forming domain-containing fimbrial protein, partial [Gammaproteobacteria bacterium]|nr:isopeptide-forming domain-containing fimbrial protein [Gammaproteobacteria bacterium]